MDSNNVEYSFEKELRNRFREYYKKLPATKTKSTIHKLFQKLKKSNLDFYLFGGFPKDIYLKKNKAIPRDIDLVTLQSDFKTIFEEFKDYKITKSRFGGVKIKFEGIDVDIWPLEKTWAFESGSVNLNDINSLSETTFLNIESIAIELFPKSKCRNVIAHGFNQAINDKLLEINLKENPFPELNIARALYAAKRLEYNFGPHLIEFISENLKSCDIDDILHIYEKKYGIVEFEKNSYRNYLTQIKISDDFYHNDLKSFKRSYSKQTNIFDKEPSSTRMKV